MKPGQRNEGSHAYMCLGVRQGHVGLQRETLAPLMPLVAQQRGSDPLQEFFRCPILYIISLDFSGENRAFNS